MDIHTRLTEYAVMGWVYRSQASGVSLCWTKKHEYVIVKITTSQDTFENEARFLRKLSRGGKHFVVQLLEEIQAPELNVYCLVFPFLDPYDKWRTLPVKNQNDVKSCFLQLLQVKTHLFFKTQLNLTPKGLCFIHNAGILHSDIKQSNLLLTQLNPPHPVFADFGHSKWLATLDDLIVGTYRYMAPELLYCLVYDVDYDP